MPTSIRLANLGDAESIALLSRDEIEHGLGWRWTSAKVRACIRDSATNVVVARGADELAGFAIMRYAESHAHLALLAVSPARREQGIGRHLLQWLEKCARTAGLERIDVEARADNPVALGFYALQGFERTALVRGYYEGRIDAVRMTRTLIPRLS